MALLFRNSVINELLHVGDMYLASGHSFCTGNFHYFTHYLTCDTLKSLKVDKT